jgi:FkbM family methyltransferase
VHEPEVKALIDYLADHGHSDFLIDIGANIGSYSRILLENTNAHVLAFEPLPEAYKELEKIQLQYGDRFTAIEEGLSNSKQNLDLYYGSEDLQLATFSESVNEISYVGKTNQQKIKVQVNTLDNYYLSNLKDKQTFCDLVKIDTEGFEYEVLQGAKIFIAEMKPKYIQIEFNLHHLYRNHSLKLIGSLLINYACFQILPNRQGLIPRDINSTESNIFHFANFVFIRKE